MEAIKDAVYNVMQVLEIKKKKLPANSLEALLKKTLTKKELKHIKFNYFKKGVLNINVDSSSWLYHLSLQKQDLLAKFVQKSDAIKDIRFRLGEIR